MEHRFDHIAIAAETLEHGIAFAERTLGAKLTLGGLHEVFGTHNALLRLDDVYLEVIAAAPGASSSRARWFGLDDFTGPPRLVNWICRVPDLAAALAKAPDAVGIATPMARGDLRWLIAVPEDGALPFGAGYPTLIEWQQGGHPCDRLPESGCRLDRLDVIHPRADALRRLLSARLNDPRVHFAEGPEPRLLAAISTPSGRVLL